MYLGEQFGDGAKGKMISWNFLQWGSRRRGAKRRGAGRGVSVKAIAVLLKGLCHFVEEWTLRRN